jgi:murein DD-endopeptidase MepM/ murein hydrolase activator NlpD
VYSIGNGIVVLARDIRADWGNVVIVRHAWIEARKLHFADSLYGHLDRILVREGAQVRRGEQVGTIGTNHGMYPPHLHFEMHKDLSIGVNHSAGTRDLTSYWVPTDFIAGHRKLHGGGRMVPTPAAHFLLPTSEHPWSFHRFLFHSQKKKSPSKTTHPKTSQSPAHPVHHRRTTHHSSSSPKSKSGSGEKKTPHPSTTPHPATS